MEKLLLELYLLGATHPVSPFSGRSYIRCSPEVGACGWHFCGNLRLMEGAFLFVSLPSYCLNVKHMGELGAEWK